MAWNGDRDEARLDDAARAGWLYYVAGNTQDEIAHKLGISRQSAQRLVSLAVSKKLIKVRLDHPIASCMALAEALTKRYDLRYCDVVPSDPSSTSTVLGVAEAAAAYLERILASPKPLVVALGTLALLAPPTWAQQQKGRGFGPGMAAPDHDHIE